MKRLLKYTALGLLGLVVLLAAGIWFVAATQTGTGLAWEQARAFLPEGIRVAGVEGRLTGPLTITGVDVRSETQHITLDKAELEWSPAALLHASVQVDRIGLQGLHVTQTGTAPEPEPEPESEPFELPERFSSPVAVRLDDFSLEDFALRSAPEAEPFVIEHAGLQAALDDRGLQVRRLGVHGPLLDIDGKTTVATHDDYPIDGGFDWQVRAPGYAPVDGKTGLDGSLKKLLIDQSLGAPYNTQADVTLTQPIGDLGFRAKLAIRQAKLQAIGADLPPVTLSTQVKASGTPEDADLHVELDAHDPEYGTVEANLDGGFADQVATLKELVVTLADKPARLEARGQVALGGEQPKVDMQASWQALRWPLAGEAIAESPQGRLSAQGTPEDLRFDLQAQAKQARTGPLQASLKGQFMEQVVRLESLSVSFDEQPTRLDAAGTVALGGEAPDVDVAVNWQKLRWPFKGEPTITSPKGTITAKGTPEDIRAQLDIAVGEGGRLTGHARRAAESIDVALDWHDLAWPMSKPQVTSAQGAFKVNGKLDDYRLDLDTRVAVPEQTDARVQLAGAGSLEALDLERIDVEALDGTLDGNARVAWKPDIDGAVELHADGLNPGEVAAEWPGKLGLALKAEGSMRDGKWVGQLEQLQANGKLRGNDVDLDAQAGYDGKTLDLKQLMLASGSTRLQAAGRVSDTLDVTWQLASEDLSQLLPEAGGSLDGQGSAQGALQRPQVEAKLTGSKLAYRSYRLDSLDLNADVDLTGKTRSKLDLTLADGKVGDIELSRIAAHGEGDYAAHELSLTARTSSGNADVKLNGDYAQPFEPDGAWHFRLTEAMLEYPELAPWRLAEPTDGRVTADVAELSRGCWASGEARLCLRAKREPQDLQAGFELKQFDFDYLANLMPPDLRVEGALSGNGQVQQSQDGALTAKLRLDTTAGRVVTLEGDASGEAAGDNASQVDTLSEALPVIDFKPANIRADIDAQAMQVAVDLPLQDQGGLQVSARIPQSDKPVPERPLSGEITTKIQDLSFIADLVPDITSIKGRLDGDMRLGGQVGQPEIQGRLALLDGAAELDTPGLNLSDITFALIGQDDGGLKLQASANSGGGSLNIDGQVNLAGGTRADIDIKGQNFEVANTPDAQAFASPDLQVAVREERIDVTGEVTIPRAAITPTQIPESAVGVSGDQVIVKPGDDENVDALGGKPAGREIHARVRVILGGDSGGNLPRESEQVRVEAFGLMAQLEGELVVTENPGEPTKGSGEIMIVDGTYKAYGQDLEIETGRILFAGGPVSEPGLDVRAVRRPNDDIVVGVEVRGTLTEPDFSLFSEPEMSQQEQLAYLVLGHALGDSSGAESSAVNQAALALGLKGGDFLAKNIGSKIGLDTVGVESTENSEGNEQASLVVGKYLSPKLYVSYGLGLFEPVSTVKLQYSISSHWKLTTESTGGQSGGDLTYTIETGQ